MTIRIHLVVDAEVDLFGIHRYVSRHDAPAQADRLLDRLQDTCASLMSAPERGYVPPELDRVGVRTFREVHLKPHRIIYEVIGEDAFVHAILDGRRNLQDLLQRRLLR